MSRVQQAASNASGILALVPHATLLHVTGAAHNDLQNLDTYLDVYSRALAANFSALNFMAVARAVKRSCSVKL